MKNSEYISHTFANIQDKHVIKYKISSVKKCLQVQSPLFDYQVLGSVQKIASGEEVEKMTTFTTSISATSTSSTSRSIMVNTVRLRRRGLLYVFGTKATVIHSLVLQLLQHIVEVVWVRVTV